MIMCCLPTISSIKVDGVPNVAVTFDPVHPLLDFLKKDFVPMNTVCERAEMFERLIYDRSKAVFEYFGLPYDAPPPE